MCGIAGIFSYHPEGRPVNSEELLRIRERMIRRGPDGAGLWMSKDQRVGLAHRRLSIIDLTNDGAQPMCDLSTGNQVVFNGEIYNYKSLRLQLEAAGHRFRSHSDTEVLLKLYAEHGIEMLHMLRGMFAFAIWDAKKRGIFLARDHFGIKPLYIADDGRTIRFASQVKALLAGGAIETTPEPAGHVGFFTWGHVPEPFTLYKNIRALPAGSGFWIGFDGRRSQFNYFDLGKEFAQSEPTGKTISLDQAREELRIALKDSVTHHMVADVHVGFFLSAGLDSSTLISLAAENRPFPLKSNLSTLTLGFREFINTESDEVPLAEAVARHYGTNHNTQWVNQGDFVTEFNELFDAMDQPSIDGVNSYFVCKAARNSGLKVAISGLGGDELFAGYSHFQSLPWMVRMLRPLAAIPQMGLVFRNLFLPLAGHITSRKAAGLIEYGGEMGGAYLLKRSLYMPWELNRFLDPFMVRQGWQELDALNLLRHTINGVGNQRNRIATLEMSYYMRNQLLRDTDWSSMAHSVEVRVPLVDIELFRAVNRLQQAGFAPSKQDLAATPSKPLPDAILKRRKTGFSVPVKDWLTTDNKNQQKSHMPRLGTWAGEVYSRCLSVN
jgi:asparagine synthase (glutamine-hydrolysing)